MMMPSTRAQSPAAARPDVVVSAAEITAFLATDQPDSDIGRFVIEAVGLKTARLRMPFHPRFLRAGGTISGPAMFAIADVAMYVAILAQTGLEGALNVTTSFNINFLRKPAACDMIADCRLMKLGRRLAVGEVWLYSDGEAEPVAHATGTYSLVPPAKP